MEKFMDTATANDPVKIHPLRKVHRKNSRATLRSISNHRSAAKQKRVIRALAKEFVSYKVSAAGISYIANAKTKSRRWMWFVAVVAAFSFMGYMTVNVVLEYLSYPKSLIREGKIASKLNFPAVTLCSLNPLLNQNIDKTSVAKLLKLKNMLIKATNVPTDTEYRDKCYGDPLCQWSWFSESCQCVECPCMTEFCMVFNSSHCVCSFTFCKDHRFRTCRSPDIYASQMRPPCFCSNEAIYKTWVVKPKLDENDLLYSMNDSDVQNVVELIRNASTYDLADIEDDMLPTEDDLIEYGVNFDSFVISCSFEGDRCFRENFTVLYHPKYGKCYMFNYIGNSSSPMESPIDIYNYGSNSGLQLVLHVTEHQAVDLLNQAIGVRVVVHNPRDLPFVAEYGINVRPNDMSAVEVALSTVKRLGPPWGSCAREGSPFADDDAPSLYSILGCEKACRHHYLLTRCNCTRRQFLRGSVFLQMDSRYTFCNYSKQQQYECMVNIIDDIEREKIRCNCKPPCWEAIYSYTVSSSKLNENFFRTVKAIRTLVTDDGRRYNITNTTGENYMVGVKVYYSTFQVDKDREVASYSWETMVANVGGNLGFFMGLTLVTFVEIFEFLWDIILTVIRRSNEAEGRNMNKIYTFSTNS